MKDSQKKEYQEKEYQKKEYQMKEYQMMDVHMKGSQMKDSQMKYYNNKKLLQPTSLYVEADRRLKELSECLHETEKEFGKAPSGIIHVLKSGTRIQFYFRANKSDRGGKYIRKSDTHTIQTLLQKSYQDKVMRLLKTEIKNLELLLNRLNDITEKIKRVYSDFPVQIKCYINPIDMSDEDYADKWMNVPYIGKEIPEYGAVYETAKGDRVRSKSELTIANMLSEKGIPYKYECPKTLLNGKVFYPDFTVLDVKSRKEIYWEHRGMMDDKDYARQAVFKMKSLMKNEIILGNNLIITEETSTTPLGTDEIEMIIRRFV